MGIGHAWRRVWSWCRRTPRCTSLATSVVAALLTPAGVVEANALLPRQRQVKIATAGAKALVGVSVVDAALTASVLQASALTVDQHRRRRA